MIYTDVARQAELGPLADNPFVAWQNEALDATPLAVGGAAAGGSLTNALNGNTHSFWITNPASGGFACQFTFSAPRRFTLVALAAHNLAELGRDVRVQTSPAGGSPVWTTVSPVATPADGAPILFRLRSDLAAQPVWRLLFANPAVSDPLRLGVVFLGTELVLPSRIYQGFAPVITPTEVELQSNVSVGGNLLGSDVVRRGSRLEAAFANVAPGFLRGARWRAFQAAFNEGAPAFFGWRPAKYPQDAHYLWRDGAALRPRNEGPADLMAFDLSARVYEG